MPHKFRKFRAITQSQTLLIIGIVFLVIFATISVPFYKSCKQKIAISKLRTLHAQLVDANHRAFLSTMTNMNEFDTTLPIDKFAETYFTSQLPVEKYCKESQKECWGDIQYKDLQKKSTTNKITYSIILKNGTVLGFSKDKNNLITLITDIDGKVGDNKLGRDVFVFYIYNTLQRPKLCEDSVYNKYYIANGLHFGGYDKCGIPHDVRPYPELFSPDLEDGCNTKSKPNPVGVGVGAACLSLIKVSNWTIDKIYPW